jgi:hypothetical protein
VTVVTKSGTNKVSGSAFYFGRDQKLNATNAFATSKPPFQQKRVGGSVGGPIALNRTHFFGGYERLMVDSAVITALPASNPFATLENGVYPFSTLDQNADARVDQQAEGNPRGAQRPGAQRRGRGELDSLGSDGQHVPRPRALERPAR